MTLPTIASFKFENTDFYSVPSNKSTTLAPELKLDPGVLGSFASLGTGITSMQDTEFDPLFGPDRSPFAFTDERTLSGEQPLLLAENEEVILPPGVEAYKESSFFGGSRASDYDEYKSYITADTDGGVRRYQVAQDPESIIGANPNIAPLMGFSNSTIGHIEQAFINYKNTAAVQEPSYTFVSEFSLLPREGRLIQILPDYENQQSPNALALKVHIDHQFVQMFKPSGSHSSTRYDDYKLPGKDSSSFRSLHVNDLIQDLLKGVEAGLQAELPPGIDPHIQGNQYRAGFMDGHLELKQQPFINSIVNRYDRGK